MSHRSAIHGDILGTSSDQGTWPDDGSADVRLVFVENLLVETNFRLLTCLYLFAFLALSAYQNISEERVPFQWRR